MRKNIVLRMAVTAVAFLACHSYALAGTQSINIPAGELTAALETLAKQSGIELVYRPELLKGLRTKGVQGALSSEDAVKKLLEGTTLTLQADPSGVLLISDAAEIGVEPIHMAQNSSQTAANNKPAASDSSAGEKKSGVQEIIVTAQKSEERLQDVPIPVSVISGRTLADNGQLRLEDYYSRLPGLNMALTGDAGEPKLSIRGVSTARFENPTVGVYMDELPYGATVTASSTSSAPDVDPGDLARVELLRGPQGTLYGAGAMGGVLKFVTVDPSTDAVSGRVQAGMTSISHGDHGHSLRGAVNVPLSATFAMRASGFTVRDPGYIDNIRDGSRDINARDSDGGRLSALWRPSEDFSLKLGAIVQRSTRLGRGDADLTLGELRQNNLPDTGHYERNVRALSATLAGRFHEVDLVSATGYSLDKKVGNLDNSPGLVPFLPFGNILGVEAVTQPLIQQTDKFTQEIRATIPLGTRTKWLTGVFYTHEKSSFDYTYLSSDPLTGATRGTFGSWKDWVSYEEYAAFTSLTVDIADRFDVQVGARVSHNQQTYESIKSGPIAIFFGGDPSITPEKISSETPVTYLVTPRFKISPDLMAYARIATGYRPGGPNTACGVPGIPCQYDADTTLNYEVGFKGSILDRRVAFDASLYYIDWKDLQLRNQQLSNLVSFTFIDNLARAKSQGVELSVETYPWQGMTMSGWVAWNDAKLTEDPPASSPFGGRRGDRLPYSSPFSASASVDQEFPLGSTLSGTIGVSFSFVGDRKSGYVGIQPRTDFPAYTQIDVRAGVRYDAWDLNAFANNLGDKRGILSSGLDAYTATFVTYIQPRTVGLSLSRTF